MDKKIVEVMIEEKELEIKKVEELLAREEIIERFLRREILSMSDGKADKVLAESQNKMHTLEKMIKANEKFVVFLKEVKDEQ